MASAENLVSTSARAAVANLSRNGFIAGELLHCIGQGGSIVDRNGKRGLAGDGDLPAARRVGRDHRAAAGCRLEQALRQSLAA